MAESRVLVDSSIWIEGLDARGPASLKQPLKALIESGRAVITEMVRLEVTGGARSDKEFEDFRADFSAVECLKITDHEWRLAETLSFNLNRKGQRVPATDLLIAAVAVSHKVPLWHADSDFERVRAAAPDFHTYWHPKRFPII